MSFAVRADAYDRFMGRYSSPLATTFAVFAGVTEGCLVLDVGCGPGALTTELVRLVGPDHVVAVDPSVPFVEAARERHPGVDVRCCAAEDLPFDSGRFDVAAAQLVVHFMRDPVAGLAEMARVTRVGGVVAACVWDHAGGTGPLGAFWDVVHELDPTAATEDDLAGAREGHLAQLLDEAGLDDVSSTGLLVTVAHPTFEEWWEPYTAGVGPAGAYVASLDAERVTALRERCRHRLPPPPFSTTARAWAARGTVR